MVLMNRVTPRRALALSTAALLAVSLTACGGEDGSSGAADGDRPLVAAGFYPLAWVSEQVGGDAVTVENLTTPGGEAHDLELSIQQTALVSEADLVVHEQGFQAAVDAAVEQNSGGRVLDAAEAVELRPADDHEHEDDHAGEGEDDHAGETEEEHAEHEDEGDHAGETEEEHAEHEHALEGDLDPHFWLDPLLMADLGDAVAEELAAIDPEGADDYAARADELRAELETLDEEYVDGLAGCERDTVVVSHDAFGYLDRYDLHMEPILGLSPDAEPTAATLVELRELIEDEGITTVFSETLVSPQTAEALAREADVDTDVLDPIEGLADTTAGEDYLSLMRANLSALHEANGC
jgi:zinc transport system substrate-binding protein